jgi:hypothetical protein
MWLRSAATPGELTGEEKNEAIFSAFHSIGWTRLLFTDVVK